MEGIIHILLQAAKTLQDSQMVTVTLLEASRDVGGRAKAVEVTIFFSTLSSFFLLLLDVLSSLLEHHLRDLDVVHNKTQQWFEFHKPKVIISVC